MLYSASRTGGVISLRSMCCSICWTRKRRRSPHVSRAQPVWAICATGSRNISSAIALDSKLNSQLSAPACTPDAGSAAPISGVLDPCNTEFSHQMTVERIYESPRVTKPYTAAQWRTIEKLGHQVDADLRTGDVRLTMGGEPTFVSLDDHDGAEWTTAALG